jgi:hypothetical protein
MSTNSPLRVCERSMSGPTNSLGVMISSRTYGSSMCSRRSEGGSSAGLRTVMTYVVHCGEE